MRRTSARLRLAAIAVCAALVTLAVREIHNVRIGYPKAVPEDPTSWFVSDPDTHYHVRRVWRLLEEGTVAGTDDYLNAPHGASIPWPPYYTWFLGAWLRPFVPSASASAASASAASASAARPSPPPAEPSHFDARRQWLEQKVSLIPAWLAALTALGLALGTALIFEDLRRGAPGGPLGGPRGSASEKPGAGAGIALAALVAGLELAFYNTSVQYSAVGVGDHHAFVTCVTVWMFYVLARGLARVRAPSAAAGAAHGGVAGALAGVLLGAWVGGLMYVLIVQAALGFLLVVHGRRPHRALAPLGFAFHVVALATLLPAVLASPWRAEFPWMVVNLSWFHPAQLALGALVFVPLLTSRTAREAGSAFARRWPFVVLVLLGGIGGLAWLFDLGPAAGIREGFAWAGRSNEFMDYITESQPLFGRATGGFDAFFKYLGAAAFLLPLGWALACWRAWSARETGWTPLLAAAPIMLVQALAQRRFADNLVLPLAFALAWLTAEGALLLGRKLEHARTSRRRLGWTAATLAALALVMGGNWSIVSEAYLKIFVIRPMQRWARGPGASFQRETRLQLEWLRQEPDAPPGSILAQWERGHTIEWGADRPSIGTNFGIYVGVDSYLDPWRFLLAEDPVAAERLLDRRDARYVQVTAHFARMIPTMLTILNPGEADQYYARVAPASEDGDGAAGAIVYPRLYRTLGLRLALDGGSFAPQIDRLERTGPSLDFLRLVHVTDGSRPTVFLPFAPGPFPLAFLYERVPGARLVAHADPGAVLTVELDVAYDLEHRTHSLHWIGSAAAGPDGRAVVRVPYSTREPNGIGQALASARWSVSAPDGSSSDVQGRVDVPERAVLTGLEIELP